MFDVTISEYSKRYDDFPDGDNAEYQRVKTRAIGLLTAWTHNRINQLNTGDFAYPFALSATVELIHQLRAANDSVPGIKSISNDGYSESYASGEELAADLKANVAELLAGTGLMGYL